MEVSAALQPFFNQQMICPDPSCCVREMVAVLVWLGARFLFLNNVQSNTFQNHFNKVTPYLRHPHNRLSAMDTLSCRWRLKGKLQGAAIRSYRMRALSNCPQLQTLPFLRHVFKQEAEHWCSPQGKCYLAQSTLGRAIFSVPECQVNMFLWGCRSCCTSKGMWSGTSKPKADLTFPCLL